MSEIQSRPARGRSTTRGGGRGGHGSRGPRSNKHTNGDNASSKNVDTSADQGELGELKRRYQSQLSTLKELFPDWTDVDLVLALEESDGGMEATIEKITEGAVSQFAEVPKKSKDRSRSKVKDTNVAADAAPTSRGVRGERRGGDSIRGGRGRGADRGRGGFRGGARGGVAANGTRTAGATSVSTADAWAVHTPTNEGKENEQPAPGDASAATQPEPEAPKTAPVAAAPPKKTWASMFAQPKPAPAQPKPVAQPPVPKEEPLPISAETSAHEVAQDEAVEAEELPIPPAADEVPPEPQAVAEEPAGLMPDKVAEGITPDIELTPSKDELTKDNVDHLPDESHPPPTETAASTVASSRDIGVATPLSMNQAPIARPGVGGFAATALKATSTAHRTPSFQRRLMEQQEAVVLPGNHAIDRAAVQFGSLGLNGEEADNLDVDEDREEAETRTQPPQHSPVAQPRAALPPAPRQPPVVEPEAQESIHTPKQAPGLPLPPQQPSLSQQSPTAGLGPQPVQPGQVSHANHPYNQFGRYGPTGIQSESSAPQQKPYDPFGHQAPQPTQYDYNNQHSVQQQPQPQVGAFSSAPDSFVSQYPTLEQRSLYQNYYGHNYDQQNTPSQQQAGATQQRTGSAFGAGPADPSYGQSQQNPIRYNDAQNSGHTTPNPALGGQQPSGSASQSQHMHPQNTGGYPIQYPNHNWAALYSHMYTGHGNQNFGFGKNMNMYGQPPYGGYGDHSSSPANPGGFSSSHDRDSRFGGLVDYGRAVSGVSHNQHAATAGGFGGFPDTLGRSYGQQQVGQGNAEDSLKPFGDAKSGGPSPSVLGGQPGRPGSATNNTPSQGGQGGFPGQQGFGGYHGAPLGQNSGFGDARYGGGDARYGGGYGGGFGGYGAYRDPRGDYPRGGWGNSYTG